MLESLKFVQGAAAKKDFVPELQHFVISDGVVKAFNGVVALSSPIELSLACAPHAVTMVKAIAKCTDVVGLTLTTNGRLLVHSGPFRSYVPCVPLENTPPVEPKGDLHSIDGESLLKALQVLAPFIGNDASRPWSNGVLLRGQSAYATNNVTLVQYWVGAGLPVEANIPAAAVEELLRVGRAPNALQAADASVTFHYEDGRWIRTQLLATDWPNVEPILDKPAKLIPVPEGLVEHLETIKPFLENELLVYFGDNHIRTMDTVDDGTLIAVPGITFEGVYRHSALRLLGGVATAVDFTGYPEPVMFQGDRLRGAIIGRSR